MIFLSFFFSNNKTKKHYIEFELKNTLGSGHFSTVKLGVSKKTGKEFAVKIIDKRKAGGELEKVMQVRKKYQDYKNKKAVY